jgi:uncharacterized protein YjcR
MTKKQNDMTTDQIVKQKTKMRRGAHPGNVNAFQHGFYSKLFEPLSPEDRKQILSTNLEDEIAMLRAATLRAFKLADQADDIDQSIKALGALGLAAIRTSRLLKVQKDWAKAIKRIARSGQRSKMYSRNGVGYEQILPNAIYFQRI